MRTGIVYDSCFQQHTARYEHPECPARLDAIIQGLKNAGIWDKANRISPRSATMEELQTVHTKSYIDKMLRFIDGQQGNLDADTFFSEGSKEAALRAAGGAIQLATMVHQRELDWGIAVVRPPGHHAESNRACGFCLLNNIAVAAGALLENKLAERVAIVDWDVHHGNGTQEQFYSNPNVLYISIHQWPHFPGSGLSDEIGKGDAKGKTINIPFPSEMGDTEYIAAFERVVLPALKAFSPQHILVSAGFDGHRDDPLAGMNLSTGAFHYMSHVLSNAAKAACNGRISFYLEGGYNQTVLRDSVAALCNGIQYAPKNQAQGVPSPEAADIIRRTMLFQTPYWQKIF